MNRTRNRRTGHEHSVATTAAVAEPDEDDFMMRFLDGSCQGVFRDGEDGCQSILPSCHLQDQLDLLMVSVLWVADIFFKKRKEILFSNVVDLKKHCRQPLSFFRFFHEHQDSDMAGVEVLPAGAYVLPTSCEYCGEADTQHCDRNQCQRPPLYFQKKRPPFAKRDATRWDPITDDAIVTPSTKVVEETPEPRRPLSPLEGMWATGLFGNNRDKR
jgi:hypothetical protein